MEAPSFYRRVRRGRRFATLWVGLDSCNMALRISPDYAQSGMFNNHRSMADFGLPLDSPNLTIAFWSHLINFHSRILIFFVALAFFCQDRKNPAAGAAAPTLDF